MSLNQGKINLSSFEIFALVQGIFQSASLSLETAKASIVHGITSPFAQAVAFGIEMFHSNKNTIPESVCNLVFASKSILSSI
ncbi:MAG: hypothetical protein LBF15_05530 [Candidatus Peribacteria bacterium]|nr:hypothetical protein [Candidatus Peribacteria bacterium]